MIRSQLKVALLTSVLATTGFLAQSLSAQPHDASLANHELHYYDIEDLRLQADEVTYAEHIASDPAG